MKSAKIGLKLFMSILFVMLSLCLVVSSIYARNNKNTISFDNQSGKAIDLTQLPENEKYHSSGFFDDFVFLQSVPTGAKVFVIPEVKATGDWFLDQANLRGETPAIINLKSGDYKIAVITEMGTLEKLNLLPKGYGSTTVQRK